MRRINRARSVPWAAAVVAATTLAWLVPSASATASSHARPAAQPHRPAQRHPVHRAAASLNSPADTGASDISNLGTGGWTVQSSAIATQTGAQISTPGFNTSTWLPVTNDDAGAPGTEIEALAQNGQCPGDTALQPVNQQHQQPEQRLLLEQHAALLREHDQDRPRLGRRVRRPLVVAHRLHAEPGNGPDRHPDRQRRRRLGQRLGERHRGGHLVHGHRRLHQVHLQPHQPGPLGHQLTRDRGQPERPDQHVHPGQRRLDPDPAGQQHRHPVPGPAPGRRRARGRQLARQPDRRRRPVQRGADRQDRRHQLHGHRPGRARSPRPSPRRTAAPRSPSARTSRSRPAPPRPSSSPRAASRP